MTSLQVSTAHQGKDSGPLALLRPDPSPSGGNGCLFDHRKDRI